MTTETTAPAERLQTVDNAMKLQELRPRAVEALHLLGSGPSYSAIGEALASGDAATLAAELYRQRDVIAQAQQMNATDRAYDMQRQQALGLVLQRLAPAARTRLQEAQQAHRAAVAELEAARGELSAHEESEASGDAWEEQWGRLAGRVKAREQRVTRTAEAARDAEQFARHEMTGMCRAMLAEAHARIAAVAAAQERAVADARRALQAAEAATQPALQAAERETRWQELLTAASALDIDVRPFLFR